MPSSSSNQKHTLTKNQRKKLKKKLKKAQQQQQQQQEAEDPPGNSTEHAQTEGQEQGGTVVNDKDAGDGKEVVKGLPLNKIARRC